VSDSNQIQLNYGTGCCFSCGPSPSQVLSVHQGPNSLDDLAAEARSALAEPIEFPSLELAVVPGDKVVLAVDAFTPGLDLLIAEVWRIFEQQQIAASSITILQPAAQNSDTLADPRSKLPTEVASEIVWKIHDVAEQPECQYLSTTENGERIYLAQEIIEADFVMTIGPMSFHPTLGVSGTNSVFYPGLSNEEAQSRTQEPVSRNKTLDLNSPQRKLVDEIGWLLGTQFSLQVLPASAGGVSHVLAGAFQSVLERGREFLLDHWYVEISERPDLIVLALDSPSCWSDLSTAISSASQIVGDEGRVVVLSDFAAPLEEGLERLRRCAEPLDVREELRGSTSPDKALTIQIAESVSQTRVYLLSGLDEDVVEDLFMFWVKDQKEVQRLLETSQSCVFIAGAQHTSFRFVES